jgi:integrase
MAIQQRGNSYRVKIFNKGVLVTQKSFPTEAEAKAWEGFQQSKLTLGKLGHDYDEIVRSPLAYQYFAELGDFANPEGLIKLVTERSVGQPSRPREHSARPMHADAVAPTLAPASGPTFGDLIARYKEEITPKKRGFKQERYMLDLLKRHRLAAKPVRALTTDDFGSWVKERLKTVTGDTVNRQLILCHHIFETARMTWKIAMPTDRNGNTFNPAKGNRQPSSEPRDFRLSPDERACLLRHAAADPWGDKMVLPLMLCFEINFRRGELFKMKRIDIHWNAKKVVLAAATTKNGKPREVPLTSRAIAILRRVVEVIEPDYRGRVFPLDGSAFGTRFHRIRARAAKEMPNIANFTFHDTRHEAISVMATKIPNAVLLAKATGHRDAKILSRYVNPKSSELADMLE